jgi:DNA-binding HxlR family transcriptional regulator
MKRKSFRSMECPIALALDRVGEWWSMLILREAVHGSTRFDQFQKALGIAPNMLTRRLEALVDSGVLERRQYSEHPPRHEYILTERGADFWPVLVTLMAWGNKHFAPHGEVVLLADRATGKLADPKLIDKRTGAEITSERFALAPGPKAGARVKSKYATASSASSERASGTLSERASGTTRSRTGSGPRPS